MPDPQINVYPDPDPPGTGGGGPSSAQMAPSNLVLDGLSLATGAAAVVVAAAGVGAVPSESLLLQASAAAAGSGYLAPAGVPLDYVWWFIGLASVSVLLGTANFIYGIYLKKRLHRLSSRICRVKEVQEIIAEEAKILHA